MKTRWHLSSSKKMLYFSSTVLSQLIKRKPLKYFYTPQPLCVEVILNHMKHLISEYFLKNGNGKKKKKRGNSLVVQCLGLCTFTAEGLGSIPGRPNKIPQIMCYGQKKKRKRKLHVVPHVFMFWSHMRFPFLVPLLFILPCSELFASTHILCNYSLLVNIFFRLDIWVIHCMNL